MEKKVVANRVKYEQQVPAEKAGEMKRLVAAAAAVLGKELSDGMRMHAEAERLQASTYFEVSDDEGGVYSVSLKCVKLSQVERMTRARAMAAAAAEFAAYLISLASDTAAMTAAAAAAVSMQAAYADYLLTPPPAGEARKSASSFFADMLKKA